jgi:hypothetical protein
VVVEEKARRQLLPPTGHATFFAAAFKIDGSDVLWLWLLLGDGRSFSTPHFSSISDERMSEQTAAARAADKAAQGYASNSSRLIVN